MISGDPNGLNVLKKLKASSEQPDKNYLRSIKNAAEKFGQAWFSDFIEQRKSKLNNQNTYRLFKDIDSWKVELFLEIKK